MTAIRDALRGGSTTRALALAAEHATSGRAPVRFLENGVIEAKPCL